MKLIALYRQPSDSAAFDRAYFGTHLPLLERVPGLLRTSITRFSQTVTGEHFYLMAEMYFEDAERLKEAMNSPEMAAAGENLNTFAEGLVTLLFGVETEQRA
jgi:uncharacterized protein (TIGR02118 family)